MVDPDIQPLVIDVGCGDIKCGFGGDDFPRAIFPNVLGCPVNCGMPVTYEFGDQAMSRRGCFWLRGPMERGIITNFNWMEKLWNWTFRDELRVTPEEHCVLLTENSFSPSEHRLKTVSMMFETFNVPALYIGNQAALAFVARGLENGVSLELGFATCCAVPVLNGEAVSSAEMHSNFAGKDITAGIVKMLRDREAVPNGFGRSHISRIAQDIKHAHSYVALDYASELTRLEAIGDAEVAHSLPDGKTLAVAGERFRPCEPLFARAGEDTLGLHELVHQSVQKLSDDSTKLTMLRNISISGGTSLITGIVPRFNKEMARFSKDFEASVAGSERRAQVWIGGSIWSDLSSNQDKWITFEEYSDVGAEIVNRKCPRK